MKFSTKTRYGIRAMVEIAKARGDEKVYQKDISERQQISSKYLDQIIQILKSSELITNVKGRKSGYRLTRKATEISIFDIHTAFEPEIAVVECQSKYFHCELIDVCPTNDFWGGLNQIIVHYFQNISLQDLVDGKPIDYTFVMNS